MNVISPNRLTRILGLTLLLAAVSKAQQPDSPAPSYTFHVQTDILQIPVLVLSEARRPLPPIDPARFTISIAGGAPFHPQVRREGDDPIALAILFDNSGSQQALLSKFPAAVSAALPVALQPQGRIMIESLDHCLLHHVLPPSPPDAVTMKQAVEQAISSPTAAELQQRQAKCNTTVKLWDSLTIVVGNLYKQPGRRILLVVTNGNDTGSLFNWNQLRTFTAGRGVTLFALSDPADSWRIHVDSELRIKFGGEGDILSELCQLTGGLSLESSPSNLRQSLSDLVTMIRDRYIVEFPRPESSKVTSSILDVRIKGGHTFIRPSGISFPPTVADAAQGAITKAQPRPIPGSRVVLAPH